jgi:hypothetical protein
MQRGGTGVSQRFTQRPLYVDDGTKGILISCCAHKE